MKIGLTLYTGLEYFLRNDFSVYFNISYDQKGIKLEYDKDEMFEIDMPQIIIVDENGQPINNSDSPNNTYLQKKQSFHRIIENQYISFPLGFKKYLYSTNLYVNFGIYASVLKKSNLYIFNRKYNYLYINEENITKSEYKFLLDGEDIKKDFTSNLDFGIIFGIGYKFALTQRINLFSNLTANMGLHKIDRKYNNYYSEYEIPNAYGYDHAVESKNYFGLNSKAKNFSLSLTFGISYYINK